MVRILANLCSIVPGRVGGSEVYASRLLSAFAAHGAGEAPDIELEVASMARTRAAHPSLGDLRWHESRWKGDIRLLRIASESTWLTRRSDGFDVVHHFGGRLPAARRGAAVLTVHDIQPLDIPANFSPAKRRYLRWALPRSVMAADVVAVPSRWVASRLEERLAVPADRIAVVPSSYATDPLVRSGGAGCEARPLGLPRALTGRRFVLYPAATYPHKNHGTLIDAHAAVWSRHNEPTLVLTGAAGRDHAVVTEHAARAPGVVHLGWVEEARLASLISSAAAVAFPSRYEGFGLPVIEAMAAGTPVIAAAVTALPEVVRDGGLLVGPDDVDGWIDALLEVLDGSAEVARRVERGRARAADFAPERAAAGLIDAWRHAAQTAGGQT
ncbi:glycosyltransferase family 4 protein [Candidatus Poriferisodalis sp.]|uniref:glycosyltransferase family 4 protein n=1 Tax=Candidatus Poriferisodalis sp. TaxID=3101277 RepID=UPI003B01B269